MKTLLLAALLGTSALAARSQTVTSYRLLPANATAADPITLVLTVFHGGCGGNYGYTWARSGNQLFVKGCYPAVAIAMPCVTTDTVRLGLLPPDSYTVTTASYIARSAAECGNGQLFTSGQPNATGSFAVGVALATRQQAPARQSFPTVLPAASSTLSLTDAATIQHIGLYDLAGREKARFDASALVMGSGAAQLPLPGLAPAVYLLRITDRDGRVSTHRFVRE